jgi:type II secretory pathway component HofQ
VSKSPASQASNEGRRAANEAPANGRPAATLLAPWPAESAATTDRDDAQAKPMKGERISVRFADADLGNALRFLADAGNFSLVARGNLSGRVNLELEDVRPYDALVFLAAAHGLVVERRGSVVLVAPLGSTNPGGEAP